MEELEFSIAVYEKGNLTPVMNKTVVGVLNAEAALRELTEKARKILKIKNS